jgi:hypothetical protein
MLKCSRITKLLKNTHESSRMLNIAQECPNTVEYPNVVDCPKAEEKLTFLIQEISLCRASRPGPKGIAASRWQDRSEDLKARKDEIHMNSNKRSNFIESILPYHYIHKHEGHFLSIRPPGVNLAPRGEL